MAWISRARAVLIDIDLAFHDGQLGEEFGFFESFVAGGFALVGLFLLSMAAMDRPGVNFGLFGIRNFVLILLMIGLIRFLISSSNVIVSLVPWTV